MKGIESASTVMLLLLLSIIFFGANALAGEITEQSSIQCPAGQYLWNVTLNTTGGLFAVCRTDNNTWNTTQEMINALASNLTELYRVWNESNTTQAVQIAMSLNTWNNSDEFRAANAGNFTAYRSQWIESNSTQSDEINTKAEPGACYAGQFVTETTTSGVVCDAEADPQVGTLTNTKWCTTDGSAINCESNEPTDTNTWNTSEDMQKAIAMNITATMVAMQFNDSAQWSVINPKGNANMTNLYALNVTKARIGGANCSQGQVVAGFTINNETAPNVYCVNDETGVGGFTYADYFNQYLNKTSQVTFSSVNASSNITTPKVCLNAACTSYILNNGTGVVIR